MRVGSVSKRATRGRRRVGVRRLAIQPLETRQLLAADLAAGAAPEPLEADAPADTSSVAAATATPLTSDFNADGVVDLLDLDILAMHVGDAGDHSAGDATGDGMVGLLDIKALFDEYGSTSGASMSSDEGETVAAPGLATGPSLASDFNADGAVDLLDLDIFGRHVGGAGDHAAGDANNDGAVNILDAELLLAEYGKQADDSANGDSAGTGLAAQTSDEDDSSEQDALEGAFASLSETDDDSSLPRAL